MSYHPDKIKAESILDLIKEILETHIDACAECNEYTLHDAERRVAGNLRLTQSTENRLTVQVIDGPSFTLAITENAK
jgi:hypothetical protein